MKRFLRHLFTTLAALSLLLSLATAAIWIRSYWLADSFSWYDGAIQPVIYRDWFDVTCSRGGIRISHSHEELFALYQVVHPGHRFTHKTFPQNGYPYFTVTSKISTDLRIPGFEFVRSAPPDFYNHVRANGLTFPLAAIFLPSLLLPALWLRSHIKRRRHRDKNACPTCGYDLRATPDRCPECGTVPSKKIIPT